ncbi:hypothetical protein ACHAXR_002171 [Thalassiosira sp. AJA248-18]
MPTHDKVLFCLCFFAYGLLSNAGFTTALHPKNKHNRWWRPSAGERRVSVVVADNNCFSEMSNNNFDNNGIHHRYEDRRHGHQGLCMTIRCGGGANNQGTANNHNNDDSHDVAIATINVTNRISIIISSIAKWYMNQLERHELRTKFMSSGILALVGDVAAQKFAHYMTTVNTISSSGLDKRRMMALFIDGMVITGPLLHYVYEFYERVLPTHDNSNNSTNDNHHQSSAASSAEANRQNNRFLIPALIHVLFDNFIMVSVYIAVLMVTTGLLEGRHYAFIPHELKHNLVPAILVSWRVSIMGFVPMQLLAFHYLPMKLRVLAVNVLDVIWVTVMSYVTHRNRH